MTKYVSRSARAAFGSSHRDDGLLTIRGEFDEPLLKFVHWNKHRPSDVTKCELVIGAHIEDERWNW
jgi:hypothetical protein